MHSGPESRSEVFQSPVGIVGYGCVSAAGEGGHAFWGGLVEGRDHSQPIVTEGWPVPLENPPPVCGFPNRYRSMRERLGCNLQKAYLECGFRPPGEFGVIFASSKGLLEDFVWHGDEASLRVDPLNPVLTDFLDDNHLRPSRALCVSNACASAHGAFFLASHWLRHIPDVLVLAADGVGPFVVHGFRSLGALSSTSCRPFSEQRDGLRLGEAAAAIWLTARPEGETRLCGVALETEGHAVTRSSDSGQSLSNAIRRLGGGEPDFVIAHGTGTVANDKVEDRVLAEHFGNRVPITATKWSIGHTLGASGLLDTIAAAECLRRQRGFAIGNTELVDSRFEARYWAAGDSAELGLPRSAIVTSLGFGGMHAAIRLEAAR